MRLLASAIGLAVLLVLLALAYVATRGKNASARSILGRLVEGADGRLSTSKLQWLLWTVVAIFGFVTVFAERMLRGFPDTDMTMPANLLVAIGFSAVTLTAAKGITTTLVASGAVDKSGPSTVGGVIADDQGDPDLSKLQMVAFTLIALAVYLIRLLSQPMHRAPVLLDIEPALMVLMGLSQGAYLGKKLTSVDTPRVSASSPDHARGGETIELHGSGFGETAEAGLVLVDDRPVPVTSWTSSKLTFLLPASLAEKRRVAIDVFVRGRKAATAAPLLITVDPA